MRGMRDGKNGSERWTRGEVGAGRKKRWAGGIRGVRVSKVGERGEMERWLKRRRVSVKWGDMWQKRVRQ